MGLRRRENSLAVKVGLGFGLVGLVLIGAVLFTIWNIQKIERITTSLVKDPTPVTQASMKLIKGIDASLAAQRDWLLTGNKQFYVERQQQWNNNVQTALSSLRAMSIEQPERVAAQRIETISTDIEDLQRKFNQIHQLGTEQNISSATDVLINQAVKTSEQIKLSLRQLMLNQQTFVVGGLQEVQSQIDYLLVTDWSLLILGLLLCGILGVMLTKSITQPIYEIVQKAKSLAQGNLDQKIHITGCKEFEELSDNFNDMVRTLQSLSQVTERMAVGDYSHRVKVKSIDDRLAITVNQMLDNFTQIVNQANAISEGDFNNEIKPRSEQDTLAMSLMNMTKTLHDNKIRSDRESWLKDGVAKLAAVLSDAHDLRKLCDISISTIARYLGAGMGVIYVFDEENNLLKLMGSHAYKERDAVANSIKIGEGVVGQVAAEQQPILLKNITREECVISTGTSEMPPQNIYTFPVLHEDRLMAVVEIATHDVINELRIKYIEEVSPMLASNILQAQQQALTMRLLEESKTLAEKLQVQQEELRSANEELEQQTQVLKASEEELKLKDEQQQAINKKLGERTKELEQQKAEIEQKNMAIRETSEQLKIKAEELERTSQYKSEFLANMSHELRTPLNSLLILAKLFADNTDGNLSQDQIESAQIMHKSGQDLLTLINDILDLAKVEAGKLEINLSNAKLQDFIETVERDFSHVTEGKGIGLVTEIEEGLPEIIFTDDHRVSQIIRNLMSNAIKFTEQGEVRFSIKHPPADREYQRKYLTKDNTIAFIVKDTGIGIPPDKQKLVFESFQQADGTTSRKYGGTGLGLSICVQLANLLGGEVDVESEEGKGSSFILYLPYESTPETVSDSKIKAQVSVSERPEHGGITTAQTSTAEPNQAIPGADTPPAQTALSSSAAEPTATATTNQTNPGVPDDRDILQAQDKVLLLVEDDFQFTKIVMGICRKKGFKCLHAPDGESGLVLAQQYKPDGIFLDLGLPGMDGLTLLEKLKGNTTTNTIPVHVISALEESDTAIKKGAIGYLTKPVTQEQLESAIHKLQGFSHTNISDLLIVEDDVNLLESITRLLDNSNVNIVGVTTGQEALEKLTSQHFDCMILDLGLPDMTGQELLEKYQQQTQTDSPAIIINTGQELSHAESEKLSHDVDSIIIKGGAASTERLLEETQLFLHRVEDHMPANKEVKPRAQSNPEEVLDGKKLLIVDDDMRNTFALSKVLKGKGMDIKMASNGKQALESLATDPDIDIVLMDIMMPVMDGYEAIQKIREQEKFKQLPIIALTAKAMSGDKEKCLNVGASDFLAKPLNTDNLISMLRVWL
ncbi:MAG: hypothetical protein CMF50_08580 [Legionellales bacterium]|nr:hypothetical protein [Legionellales bacterium]